MSKGLSAGARLRGLLVEQACESQKAFEALEAFLVQPSEDKAERVRALALAVAGKGCELERALDADEAVPGSLRRSLFLLGRALERMSACGVAAAEETLRFGAPADGPAQDMAHAARRAAEDLAAALGGLDGDPEGACGKVIEAKRNAGRLEQLRRKAAVALAAEPGAVAAMKAREIHRRFSDVALQADEAAELIGDLALTGGLGRRLSASS